MGEVEGGCHERPLARSLVNDFATFWAEAEGTNG
jgi:hypothetical protein